MNEPRRRGLLVVLEGADGAGSTTQADRLALRLEARGEAVVRVDQPARRPAMMTAPGALLRSMLAGHTELPTSALAMQALFIADRFEQHTRFIDPAIERGAIVVSDRGELSTLAYGVATEPLYRCKAPGCLYRSDLPMLPVDSASPEDVEAKAYNARYLDETGDRFGASVERSWLLRHALHRAGAEVSSHPHELLFVAPLLANALMAPHRLLRRPDLTLVLQVPAHEASRRRDARGLPADAFDSASLQERVGAAYGAIHWLVAEALPGRYSPRSLRTVDAGGGVDIVESAVWAAIEPMLGRDAR